MEMPITKPSMVSYADELDFSKLMEDLANDNKNGFIRVTSRSEEGYILYKNGKQAAASYEKYSKIEALEKIGSALEHKNTLIEVFDVGPSQVDYLLDLNKPYIIEEGSNVYDVIGELKKTAVEPPEEPQEEEISSEKSLDEDINLEEPLDEGIPKQEKEVPKESPEEKIIPEVEESSETGVVTNQSEETAPVTEMDKPIVENSNSSLKEDSPSTEPIGEPETDDIIKPSSTPSEMKQDDISSAENVVESDVIDEKLKAPSKAETEVESSSETPMDEEKPIDRMELLKKYGIKDVQDDDVENLLQSYKGGIIDDDDVERVELVLMNLIKKSVLGIPKIKGTEVMVFLDNYKELTGTINIITEYENQGFLNRFMGQSRTATNLRRQIINIAEIAIKKSFRQYPEVVEKFEINVEFS
nr:DUF2226 domain-containing protein [uncultured Methanobacterium sp.]